MDIFPVGFMDYSGYG